MEEGLEEVVKEFLVESYENLDQLDRDFVTLEEQPSDRDTLSSIFRTIHTIKGTCGFLGFGKLEKVAHVGESLLSRLRDGKLQLSAEMTSALLRMVDAVREILKHIETSSEEGNGDYSALIADLTRLQEEPEAPSAPTTAAAPPPPPAAPAAPVESQPLAPAKVVAEGQKPTVAESNVRVDVGLLDRLMNLVGELVLARNQILQFISSEQDATFLATTQRLNLITTELQESVMMTRMQPIGNVWSKFPRVVRDLAVACGKQIRIEMEGKETELDKTIIEAIKDPLTHLLRNSVDHGIEMPEQRQAVGKPCEGRLLLRAFHEGGQVNVEITDDGGGIDPAKLKAKALQKGLITPDQAARMNDQQAINLIFAPGFSTAEKVTNISGRGVGMDVVKTNIEKIGGVIEVQSRIGQGTTLRLKIPLTLAIIPALIVTWGAERYAIPQGSLVELVRLETSDSYRGIERVHGAPVYRLRGNLLPLVDLGRELGMEASGAREVTTIVVLQADGRQFGLVVEGVLDAEEIVVKPLGKQLIGLPVFAGATIMGDGRVVLILDVLGIAYRAHVISAAHQRALTEELGEETITAATDRQALLVLAVGESGRMAIPLTQVARLEEFPRAALEHAGQREVVQYRSDIMPLIRLSEVLGMAPGPEADPMQVVVYSDGEHSIGLVVERILDIVEEAVTLTCRDRGAGVRGSAVIQRRVTDVLDVDELVHGAR